MSLAVENSLEDWMGLYNSVIKVTLLPYPPLESELPDLRRRCDIRDDHMMLIPRRIKMVLLIFVGTNVASALILLQKDSFCIKSILMTVADFAQVVRVENVYRTAPNSACFGT